MRFSKVNIRPSALNMSHICQSCLARGHELLLRRSLEALEPLAQVIDEEICFKASVHSNIYELYHCRAQMHSNVYNHRFVLLQSHHYALTMVLSAMPARGH